METVLREIPRASSRAKRRKHFPFRLRRRLEGPRFDFAVRAATAEKAECDDNRFDNIKTQFVREYEVL